MKAKIRYAVNGKEYEEDIIDVVIYNKAGEHILYAYSTIEDEYGVCVIRPGKALEDGYVVYPKEPSHA